MAASGISEYPAADYREPCGDAHAHHGAEPE